MAGGVVTDRIRKIKGGKLTVLRFFAVSVAYTIGWYTISSELGDFKLKYGPQILLQLNIAYYLPSIPLLLISGQSDEYLERQFGVVRVVLVRLIVGMVGCALVTALFPLSYLIDSVVQSQLFILGMTMLLGVFVGIAFSASYQLVSRFANKNVISLGLGFVGGGLVTLLVQVALRLTPWGQVSRHVLMYEIVTVFTLLGLACALSILLKHWKAIEEDAAADKADLMEPLMRPQGQNKAEEGAQDSGPLVAIHRSPSGSLTHRHSLPSLVAFDFLDPYQSIAFVDTDDYMPMYPASLPGAGFLTSDRSRDGKRLPRYNSLPSIDSQPAGSSFEALHGRPIARAHHTADSRRKGGLREHLLAQQDVKQVTVIVGPQSHENQDANAMDKPAGSEQGSEAASEGATALREILCSIWPILTAFFLSGVTILTVFPFFTYVQSSGMCGQTLLPKVLFFTRLGGDIVGRLVPRVKALAFSNQFVLMALGFMQFVSIPLYIVYLKAPHQYHSDIAIIVYVVVLWLLCGYTNTLCNIVAPKLVKPQLKAGAAGLMAITFQVSHFSGLLLAVLLSIAFFGGVA